MTGYTPIPCSGCGRSIGAGRRAGWWCAACEPTTCTCVTPRPDGVGEWEATHILGRVGGETATAPSKPTEYLYGLPGAERAFDSPGACYEAEIDWDDDASDRAWTIEKWTAAPASRDLPSVDDLIEWVVEHAAEETTEDGGQAWEHAGARDDVKAAFRAALDLLASHVDYKLCDQRVGTHIVTFDEGGEPLLDGQPMYGTAVAR